MRKNGLALRLASARLRADVRVVKAAVEHYDGNIVHALDPARHDEAVNLAALARSHGVVIDWLVAPLNSNPDFMQRAVRANPYALLCASDAPTESYTRCLLRRCARWRKSAMPTRGHVRRCGAPSTKRELTAAARPCNRFCDGVDLRSEGGEVGRRHVRALEHAGRAHVCDS